MWTLICQNYYLFDVISTWNQQGDNTSIFLLRSKRLDWRIRFADFERNFKISYLHLNYIGCHFLILRHHKQHFLDVEKINFILRFFNVIFHGSFVGLNFHQHFQFFLISPTFKALVLLSIVLEYLPGVFSYFLFQRCLLLRFFAYSLTWVTGIISHNSTDLLSINLGKAKT